MITLFALVLHAATAMPVEVPPGTYINEQWLDANCQSATTCPLHITGTVISGCTLTAPCNHPGVKWYGDGMGDYASTSVASGDSIVGPSVIQCSVDIYTGADNWEFHDLSVDVGDALVSNGTCAEGGGIDAFSNYHYSILPPIRNLKVSNVSILLRSPGSLFHGFKCENVSGCFVDHSKTLFGVHGFTVKCGTNIHLEDLWSAGHQFDDYIIKAGETGYVPCDISEVWLRDSTATYAQPGDSGGTVLQWQNGNLNDITLTNINYVGTTFTVHQGGDQTSTGTGIFINNARVH